MQKCDVLGLLKKILALVLVVAIVGGAAIAFAVYYLSQEDGDYNYHLESGDISF